MEIKIIVIIFQFCKNKIFLSVFQEWTWVKFIMLFRFVMLFSQQILKLALRVSQSLILMLKSIALIVKKNSSH